MARENKLYSKTRVTSIAQDDLLTIGQLQSDGTYKVKTITRNNAMASFVGSYTYDELTAIVTASELIVGAPYLITNATSANINLIVSAVAVNKIGCDAKSPLFPLDKMEYDFTNNIILFRWDTEKDISAFEDWRNSANITIGAGSSNIHLGDRVKATIGTNCFGIEIDSVDSTRVPTPSTSTIANNCYNIKIGSNCDGILINVVGARNIEIKPLIATIDLSAIPLDFTLTTNYTFNVFEGNGKVIAYYNDSGVLQAEVI